MTRWAVPVFFMVSGSHLLDPKQEVTSKKLYSYKIRLIKSFIIWSLIYTAWNIFYQIKFNNTMLDSVSIFKMIYEGPYHFWFIFVMLGLYIITPYLRKVIQFSTVKEVKTLLTVWILFSIVQPIFIKFNVGIFEVVRYWMGSFKLVGLTGYLGYFILGYYLSITRYKYQKGSVVAFVCSSIFMILFTFYLERTLGSRDDFWQDNFSPLVLIQAITVFLMSKNSEKLLLGKKDWLEKLSKASFGVYLCHDLILSILFQVVGFDTMRFNPLWSIPVISGCIAMVGFCLSIIWRSVCQLKRN